MVYDKPLDDVVKDMRRKKQQQHQTRGNSRGQIRGRGISRGNFTQSRGMGRGTFNNNQNFRFQRGRGGRGSYIQNYRPNFNQRGTSGRGNGNFQFTFNRGRGHTFRFNNNNNTNFRGTFRGGSTRGARARGMVYRAIQPSYRGTFRGRGGFINRAPPTRPRFMVMTRTVMKNRNFGPRGTIIAPRTPYILNPVVNRPVQLQVSNLHVKVSEQDIEELFTEFGEIEKISLHFDREGKPQGSCDINFANKSDAIRALRKYNQVPLDGKPMNIRLVEDLNRTSSGLGQSNVRQRMPMQRIPTRRVVPIRAMAFHQKVLPHRQLMLQKVRKSLTRANKVKNFNKTKLLIKNSPNKKVPNRTLKVIKGGSSKLGNSAKSLEQTPDQKEKEKKRYEEELDKQLDAYLTKGSMI